MYVMIDHRHDFPKVDGSSGRTLVFHPKEDGQKKTNRNKNISEEEIQNNKSTLFVGSISFSQNIRRTLELYIENALRTYVQMQNFKNRIVRVWNIK